MEKRERCQKVVWKGFHKHRCLRYEWKDGYCRQHHPAVIKERDEKRRAEWERKRAEAARRFDEKEAERRAVARLQEVTGADSPAAAAALLWKQQLLELHEALEAVSHADAVKTAAVGLCVLKHQGLR